MWSRDRGFDRALVARLIVGALLLAYLPLGWVDGDTAVDHFIDLRTADAMHHGAGYYDAMDAAMRVVGHAPVETVRAFRLPTVFLVWRLLPGEQWIWVLFVLTVGVTALLTMRCTERALSAPLLTALLLATGVQRQGTGWLHQFAVVELWVAPFTVGVLLAWRRGRRAAAAWVALAATAVRVLAGGLLLGGLVGALRRRTARAHWIGASALAAAGYGLHAIAAEPHLVAAGAGVERPLLGTGGPGPLLDMAGFGLPLPEVVAAGVWIVAIAQAWRRREEPALALLALPLAGLVADRPYWGLVSLPVVVILGWEGIVDGWLAWRARPEERAATAS